MKYFQKHINKQWLFIGKLLICISLLYPLPLIFCKYPIYYIVELYNKHYHYTYMDNGALYTDGHEIDLEPFLGNDNFLDDNNIVVHLLLFILGMSICILSTKNQIYDDRFENDKPLFPLKLIFKYAFFRASLDNILFPDWHGLAKEHFTVLYQAVLGRIIRIWIGLIILGIIIFTIRGLWYALSHYPEAVAAAVVLIFAAIIFIFLGYVVYKAVKQEDENEK